MKTQPLISAVCVVAVLSSPFGALQPLKIQPLQAQTIALEETAASTDGVEVLPRGPVHEAFAEPVIFDPAPGMVVSQKPPEPVEELPPEEKPEGDNIIWVPGYWAWDDDIDNFIWVSGFWRAMPPGRQWVPGYWAEVTGGFQWISGFWAAAESREVEYLPTPPESLEYGPSTAAPSENHFWAPGTWQWYESRYVWRPGTWTIAYPNWVWVPSYYVWTPRGCIWVNGYWDYGLANRGLLYAPVRFTPSFYTRVGYAYSPSFVVDVGLLTSHFFVRPSCRHYYFGDYHHTRYLNSGFYPWFSFHSHRHHYDPIYAHHRHHHGHDWDHRLRADYRTLRDHHDRSPHDFNRGGRGPFDSRHGEDHSIVRSARDIASRPDSRIRLEKIAQSKRDEFKKIGRDTRQLAEQRTSLERIPGRDRSQAKPLPGQRGTPRLQLPKSPVASVDPTPSRRGTDPRSSERKQREKSGREEPRTSDRPENRDRRFPDFGNVPSSRTKVGRPDIDRQGKDRPSADRPGADLPGADRTGSDRIGKDRIGTDRAGTGRTGTDLPGTSRPTIERPNSDRPKTDRSSADQFKDRLKTGQSAFDRPDAGRPDFVRPRSEWPGIHRPDKGKTGIERTNTDRPQVTPRPNPFKREPGVPKSSPVPGITTPNPTISPSLERPRVDLNRPSNSSSEVRRRADLTSPSTPGGLPDAGRSIQPRPGSRPPSLDPRGIRPEGTRRDIISPRSIPNTSRPEVTTSRPRPVPAITPNPTPRTPQLDRSSRLNQPTPEIRNRITPPTSSVRTPTPSPAPRIQPRAIQPRPEPRSAPIPSARIQSSRPNRPEVRIAPTPSPRIPPTVAPGNRDRSDRKR